MRKPLFFVLLLALTMSPAVLAGECDAAREQATVVRDSSSRYTTHDRLRPLTSTYLDTASTRLIDARRGFRPYHTVYRDGRRIHAVRHRAFSIHPRPSYHARNRPQAERTGVLQFRGQSQREDSEHAAKATQAPQPVIVVIRDERPEREPAQREAQPEPAEPMVVTIYEGEADLPETSGAVIVRQDGTVISVGD